VEALTNRQVTVGGPYFRETTVPLFLLLLFLAGVGPLLPWRRASAESASRRLTFPAVAGAAVIVGLAASGIRDPAALAAFGLAAFVGVANLAELGRGVRAFARASGARLHRAAIRAAARNRRLYGGLIAHVGIAVAVVAITASTAFAAQTEVTLAPMQTARFAGYTLRYEGQRLVRQPQRDVRIATVAVSRGGRDLGVLRPSMNFYPSAPNDPIGTPSIHYGVLKDLYSSVIGFGAGRATFRIFLNPGVMWLWVGGFVVAIGGLVAAWPGRRRRTVLPLPEPTRAAAVTGS